MKKILIVLVGASLLLGVNYDVNAQFWRKKKKEKTELGKKETQKEKKDKRKEEYDKLFKDKEFQTYKGMITIHKFKKSNKLFFEFPKKLLNRDMLLGSTVSQISDNGNSIVGQKPHEPLHIKWTIDENFLQLKKVNSDCVKSNDKNIQKAIENSYTDAIYKQFEIKAYTKDSLAVVVDVTKFFKDDNEEIDPFDPYSSNTYYGFVARRTKIKNDECYINEIKAFDDNICIVSDLTYTVDLSVLGMFLIQYNKYTTAKMARSMVLLPEKPMRPRIADPRMNIFFTAKNNFNTKEAEASYKVYANHWNLEPKNILEWQEGMLSEPKQPIVFYVDDAYPEPWKKYIKLGVEDWNEAFEAIGFKNAIVAKPFPTKEENPEFDPNNIKYSCLRYAPVWTANSMGPSWVDPRSGEIINASVYSYHNIAQLLRDWRLILTSQCDKRVRTKKLDDELFGQTLRYVIAHEIGHCLGFMHNMSASAAIPTEKLRDPEFTKIHGTTYSIMDYARWNYVAQPGDMERGVRMSPPRIGLYDYWAVKWLYTPMPQVESAEDEVPVLKKWISEKSGDPRYRYGKQQIYLYLDPSSQTEDLGDNAVKSSSYGIKNLKYIVKNLNKWVKDEDDDRSFRKHIYFMIWQQYKRYIDHVMLNIAGIYVNESFEGDKIPPYKVVSKQKQQEALEFLLQQVKDTKWIEEESILRNITLDRTHARSLRDEIFGNIIGRATLLDRTNYRAQDDSEYYAIPEYLNTIFDFTWNPTKNKKDITKTERMLQIEFVNSILSKSLSSGKSTVKIGGIQDEESKELSFLDRKYIELFGAESFYFSKMKEAYEYKSQLPYQGFDFQKPLIDADSNYEAEYYTVLMRTKEVLEKYKNKGSQITKAHYELLLHKITKALKKD